MRARLSRLIYQTVAVQAGAIRSLFKFHAYQPDQRAPILRRLTLCERAFGRVRSASCSWPGISRPLAGDDDRLGILTVLPNSALRWWKGHFPVEKQSNQAKIARRLRNIALQQTFFSQNY